MMLNLLLRKGLAIAKQSSRLQVRPKRGLVVLVAALAGMLMLPDAARAQTTVTLLNYGTAGSFNSGSVTPAGVKSEGNMVNLTSSTTTGQRGWAEFDLSSIPAGADVTSVTVNFTTYGSSSSTALNNIYGFTGNAATLTGAALYAAASGTSFDNSAWTADAANSKVLNASGVAFIESNIGSTINLGFVRASTNVYNIYGYNSDFPPTLTVTYTGGVACTGTPTAGSAGVWPMNRCQGQPFWLYLTGQTAAAGINVVWQSSPTLGGPYTDIPGSNDISFNTSQSATTFYQAKLTCNGANEIFTTPIEVTTIAPIPTSTFTINQNAPASATNFTSFASAIASLQCGIAGTVTFNVVAGSGPYSGQITIPAIAGASASNRVIFNGNGNTLTWDAAASASRTTLTLDNADFITINNFTIEGTDGTYAWGIHLFGDTDGINITNSTINMPLTGASSTNMVGIVASGSATSTTTAGTADGNLFSGNTINGGGTGILMIGNGTTAPGMNNQIIDNTIQDYYSAGIDMDDQHNLLVRSNDMSRPTRSANSTTHYGIFLSGINLNNLVEKNRIHNTFDALPSSTSNNIGIYLSADGTAAAPNRIENNLIYNMNSGSIVYGMQAAGAEYAQYYHNTVSLDDETTSSTSVTRGFWESTASAGAELRNNIISVTRAGTGQRAAVHLIAASALVSNNNVLYVNSPAGTNMIGALGTTSTYTSYTALSDWQLAGYDLNSRSVDPMFADPANADFTPNNAIADNIGAPVGVLTDFTNATRSTSTPDPGAFEFDIPVSCDPPTGINAVVSPTQAEISWNVASTTGTFTLIYGPTGFDPATGGTTVNNIAGSPYTITGLTPVNSYQVYVQQNCGGSGLSLLVGPYNFSTPCVPLAAGTYSIDQTSATSATNFQSFAAAINAMCGGITGAVTFEVTPGTGPYNEQVSIPEIGGTSATSRVNFIGNGETLTFSASVSAARYTLQLNNADYITISGFTIVATNAGSTSSSYGWGVHLFGDADNNEISGNTINLLSTYTTAVVTSGIAASGSNTSLSTGGTADNNLISDNTVTGGHTGIILVGNNATTGNNNQVIGNTVLDYYANGIELEDQAGALVSMNDISRPNRSDAGSATHAGITLGGASSQNNLIEKNHVHNSHDAMATSTTISYGIYFVTANSTTGIPNRVENNLVYNMNSNSTIYGLFNSNSDQAVYYHNTISLDNTVSTSTGVTRGFYQLTEAHDIVLRNNIISITRGGNAIKTGIYLGTAASTVSSDYNVIYVNSASGTSNVGYNGTARQTLANWQSQGYDLNGSDRDPQFNDPATGDFTPTNPLLDNLGTPVGVLEDLISNPRSATTPDVGAIEFTIPPCATADGGTTVAGSAFICGPGTVQLTNQDASGGPGTSYMWESSLDNFATAGVATGGTDPLGFTATLSQTTYFRLAVQCATNSSTDYSNTVTVEVRPVPTATAVNNGPVCEGGTITLNGSSNVGTAFNWTGPNSFTSSDQNPTISAVTLAANGAYQFVATANGCSSVPAVTVVSISSAVTAATASATPAAVCAGGTVNLASSGTTGGYLMNGSCGTGFIDISATGASIGAITDDSEHNITLPFTFNFGGTDYTDIRVGVNGAIVFGATSGNVNPGNACLPASTFGTAGVPGAAIFWDDLDLSTTTGVTSAIQTEQVGSVFVIQWTNIAHDDFQNGAMSFQIQLEQATNKITFVYTDIELGDAAFNAGAAGTVGLNFSSTSALQYSCDLAALSNGQCISFTPNTIVSYAWTGPNGFTSNSQNPVLSNLTGADGGTYEVTITNAGGCAATATTAITVNEVLASLSAQTNVSCFGGSNGSATVTASGGTGTLTYIWSPSGGTSATATGLAAGTYTVTVTDVNGCTTTATATITEPSSALSASISAQTNVSCFGGSNGSATVTATGGTAGYTYQWAPAGGTAATATGLAAGTYTVTVTDANSCTTTATATIIEPSSAVSVSIASQTNVSCFGGSNGVATAAGSGGTGTYSYSWSNGATGATATGLATGSYTVTITDANGCTSTATATISQPAAAVSASITAQTNVSCFGGSNGTATVGASGGTGAFTYVWSPSGGAAATATGLAAGTYTVTVTDANGCSTTATTTITEPASALSASITAQTNASCNGQANGSATVTATGGSSPYSYNWSPSGGNTATASGLAAGTYTVLVTDDNGCTTTATGTITEPAAVVATAGSNSPVIVGATLNLTATGGITYTWTGPNGFASTDQNPTITPATTLNAGTYTVTVETGGCTATATTTVTVTMASVMSGVYTINQMALPSATNFVSFNAAAAALNTAGVSGAVTINVVAGTGPYTDQFWLGQIPGSSTANTVTINGNGQELTYCGSVTNRDIVRLNGTDNITVNGLALTTTCFNGWGIHVMGDVSNVTLTNNTINLLALTSTWVGHQAGIVATNSENNPQAAGGLIAGLTVSGNTINNGYYAIRLQSVSPAVMGTGVVVSNNTINAAVGAGIDVRNLINPTLSGNQVTMAVGSTFHFKNSVGLIVVGAESGLTVTGNKVTNAGTQGMYLGNVNMVTTTRGTVANNMIGGGFQNANLVHAVQLNAASYLDVYYNSTLADNGAAGSGMYVSNQFSRFLNMENNSFAFTGPGAGYAMQANNGNSNFLSVNYNNYYTNGAKFVRFGGADRLDLTELRTAPGVAGHDMQSMSANPLYVSATDLHLQSGSPLIAQANAGVGIATDFDGNARTNPTDIGADEYAVTVRLTNAQLEAEVYPNPFASALTVKVTCNVAADIQVTLTDLMGRQVLAQTYGVEAGTHSLTLNVEQHLAQGVYLLQVSQGNASSAFRVVKQ